MSKGWTKVVLLVILVMPNQHNLPNTHNMPTPNHPIPPTHSFSLSTELFMSLFAHAGQVLFHSLLRNPISQPVSTVPHSQWSKQPPHCTDPSTKTHLCLTQTKHIHMYSLKHTHKFSSLCRSQTQCREWMPVLLSSVVTGWIKRPSVPELPEVFAEVWAEPRAYWPIPFNPLFVEPPIYLLSLLLPHCQLQLFWVWKHIQKRLQH